MSRSKADASTTVALRITIVNPPPGVRWAMQLGKSELVPPTNSTGGRVQFDFTVTVAPALSGRGPRLLGPAVQGPPDARFVYLNSGRRAGEPSTAWDRRAKVSLMGLTNTLIAAAQQSGLPLAAEIAGVAKDGGPACASVPFLGNGWQLA